MKKLFFIFSTLMFTVVLIFANFAGAAPKGTLRVAQADFFYESMDPINFESFWGYAMYDPLLTYDEKGNVIGAVAESWTLSPDGNTWTFKIRKGMKFHNGDPVTSADVAFSLKRFASKESKNAWSPYIRNSMDSMETPDEYTFIYRTKKPEPQLTAPFCYFRILPKKYIEEKGIEYFCKHPIGSGPYKFVKHVPETSMEMEAYTENWRVVPAFERVIEYQHTEEATRIAMLKRGEVDLIGDLSYDRVIELQKEGYATQSFGLPTLGNFSFSGTWMTDGPTKDIRVRKAMSYAINRQEICDTFFKGLAEPGGRWFMDEHTWGWDPSWKADPYDPEKARALLKEAGYPDKFAKKSIDLFHAPGGIIPDLMQILQGYWAEVGIDVNIKVVDYQEYGGLIFIRKEDASSPIVGGIWPWVYYGAFNNVYMSANMFTSKGVHTTANDPKADALYDKAVRELDPEKAKQYWTEFMAYANDMYVNVGIMKLPTLWIKGSKVGKVTDKSYLSIWDSYADIQHK